MLERRAVDEDRRTSPDRAERRRDWLERARLYLVCEARPGGREPEELLRPALQAGVDVVQLREKSATSARSCGPGASSGGSATPTTRSSSSTTSPSWRSPAPPTACTSARTTRDPDEVRRVIGQRRADRPLDALAASRSTRRAASTTSRSARCYATPTKPEYEPVGLELVRYAAEHATVPFFAIGGIDAGNVDDVLDAGAERSRSCARSATPTIPAKRPRAASANRAQASASRLRLGCPPMAGREKRKRERRAASAGDRGPRRRRRASAPPATARKSQGRHRARAARAAGGGRAARWPSRSRR